MVCLTVVKRGRYLAPANRDSLITVGKCKRDEAWKLCSSADPAVEATHALKDRIRDWMLDE
jgi:hypothetical protein